MLLFWLAGAFICGVLLGEAVELPLLVVLAVVAASVALAWRFRATRWPVLPLALISLCFGVARTPHTGPPTAADLAHYNGHAAVLTGKVDAEPDVRDTGANYQIAVDTISVAGHSRKVSGDLLVHTSRAVVLEYGDAVQLKGVLTAPQNTPVAPFRDILAQRGIVSEMRFPRLTDQGPSAGGWLSWIVPLRQHIEDGINAWLPEPEAALLIAITLGARSAALGDLAPALVATGLIHLIAISGIKVAMVAGVVHQVARRFAHRVVTLFVSLCVIWFYVVLTGWTASGVRSAIMWTVVLLAWFLGRPNIPTLSLAVVAAIMVGVDPNIVHNIGFQMSVAGTLFIVLLADPIERAVRFVAIPLGGTATEGDDIALATPRRVSLIPSPFRESAAVTIAAQLGTLPIVIFGFHVVPLIGPFANAILLPLLPLDILLGFALGVLGGVAGVAAPLSSAAYGLTHLIVTVAQSLSGAPGILNITSVSTAFTMLWYLLLAGVGTVILRRLKWVPASAARATRRELALGGTLSASLLTVWLVGHTTAAQPTRLTWLGSGSSILLQSGGQVALIDGSPQPLDLLDRIGEVLPFDTHAIDDVIVTSPQSSSIAGLLSVLDHYRVSELLDVGAQYPSSTYVQWRGRLRGRIPMYALRTGTWLQVGAVKIEVDGPDATCAEPARCAGLLRITLPRSNVLVATTANREEQFEATFRGLNLRADIVLCGDAGCDPTLLRAAHARRAMVAGSGLLADGPVTVASR